MTTSEATVFIVDDDAAACASVGALARAMGLKAETFSSAEEFFDAYDLNRPGCVVTDFRMLGMDGIELTEKLARENYMPPVIVISAFGNVPLAVRALHAGAMTFLEKTCRDYELWDSIAEAVSVDAKNRQKRGQQQEIESRLATLTQEERQVMDLMSAGRKNKAIAAALDVSVRTVEQRRKGVFTKTKTKSVAQLVRLIVKSEESAPEQAIGTIECEKIPG